MRKNSSLTSNNIHVIIQLHIPVIFLIGIKIFLKIIFVPGIARLLSILTKQNTHFILMLLKFLIAQFIQIHIVIIDFVVILLILLFLILISIIVVFFFSFIVIFLIILPSFFLFLIIAVQGIRGRHRGIRGRTALFVPSIIKNIIFFFFRTGLYSVGLRGKSIRRSFPKASQSRGFLLLLEFFGERGRGFLGCSHMRFIRI